MPLNTFAFNATAFNQQNVVEVCESHAAIYGYSPSAAHEASYGVDALTVHAASYGQFNGRFHTSSYEYPAVFTVHEAAWQAAAIASHDALYSDSITALASAITIHESLYSDAVTAATSAYVIHESLYSDAATALTSAITTHTAIYQAQDTATLGHAAAYQSVVLAVTEHATRYLAENQLPACAIHQVSYRYANVGVISNLSAAYIDPDILLVECQITADEDSPYYQCQCLLQDSSYYQRFARDQAFTVNLLGIEFAFVVDRKELTRNIDDAGNYSETFTLHGLSPLCLKASPRNLGITKTWNSAIAASEVVAELIGPVTWNLIDWMVPAYRLSADNADPLELAKQVAGAAGGLIESQPDGSVVVRHRWPTSIVDLDGGTLDTTLTERTIFSASESPTQDDLRDRFRIADSDAGYQDKLEYVPDKLADGQTDDPRNGVLYAYLSPWRDGLTLATTRPTQIVFTGQQTEGTRRIYDDPDDPDNSVELLTFDNGQSGTQYPIMQVNGFTWLDEDLGSIVADAYSTTVQATSAGNYYGYSLAELDYTTRYISIPVRCLAPLTEEITAQFLLLEQP